MIDQADLAGGGAQGPQVRRALFGAGHAPERIGDLLALLPVRRRPDVLGMGREGPGAPGQDRRVAHHGGGRVQVMHVDVPNVGRHLPRHDEGLPQAARPVRGEVALEIGPERAHEPAETGPAQREEHAAQHAQRLLVEIFRQIGHRRLDPAVHRVNRFLGRVPQRPDFEVEPAILQGQDFLRDEGLGEARITLHDDGDASGSNGRRHIGDYSAASEAGISARRPVRALSRSWTRSRPSSRPGTTTSDGRGCVESWRSAAAIRSGVRLSV